MASGGDVRLDLGQHAVLERRVAPACSPGRGRRLAPPRRSRRRTSRAPVRQARGSAASRRARPCEHLAHACAPPRGRGSYTTTSTPFRRARPAQPAPMTPPPTQPLRRLMSSPSPRSCSFSRTSAGAEHADASMPSTMPTARSTSCAVRRHHAPFEPEIVLEADADVAAGEQPRARRTAAACGRSRTPRTSNRPEAWFTSARSVPTSSGAPYGMPMQSWSMHRIVDAGPRATQLFREARDGRCRRSRSRAERRALGSAVPSRGSIDGVFVIT